MQIQIQIQIQIGAFHGWINPYIKCNVRCVTSM